MTRVWTWLRAIRAWLARPFRRRRALPPELPPADRLLRAVVVDEQPDVLDAGTCYLIGEDEDWWFAAFACPCGCGAEVVLNLLAQTRPQWRVEVGDNRLVTVSPSIDRHVGCRSHFFVRNGSVLWANAQTQRRGAASSTMLVSPEDGPPALSSNMDEDEFKQQERTKLFVARHEAGHAVSAFSDGAALVYGLLLPDSENWYGINGHVHQFGDRHEHPVAWRAEGLLAGECAARLLAGAPDLPSYDPQDPDHDMSKFWALKPGAEPASSWFTTRSANTMGLLRAATTRRALERLTDILMKTEVLLSEQILQVCLDEPVPLRSPAALDVRRMVVEMHDLKRLDDTQATKILEALSAWDAENGTTT